jgi:hypothetical protein
MLIVSNVLDGEHEYLRAQFSESQIMLLRQPASPCTRGVEPGKCSPLHVQHDRPDNLFFNW